MNDLLLFEHIFPTMIVLREYKKCSFVSNFLSEKTSIITVERGVLSPFLSSQVFCHDSKQDFRVGTYRHVSLVHVYVIVQNILGK